MSDSDPSAFVPPVDTILGEPPTGQRAAWHMLAATVRRLNEGLVDLHASEADLVVANARAEALIAELAAMQPATSADGASGHEAARRGIIDKSPIIGLANPVAGPITISVEGDRVIGRVRFGKHYEGPPGHVHGGVISGGFDEVLGVAQKLTARPGFTGTLTVRYRKPTPLYDELRFEAWIERTEERKQFIAGTLHHGETLCADAQAIFVFVDSGAIARMVGRPDSSTPSAFARWSSGWSRVGRTYLPGARP